MYIYKFLPKRMGKLIFVPKEQKAQSLCKDLFVRKLKVIMTTIETVFTGVFTTDNHT